MRELINFILHVDDKLLELVGQYGTWTYAILFGIIFAETGLVVTPFLPGDSLLFAAGAIAGDPKHGINVVWLCALLTVAAILGDTVNYHCGYYFGAKLFCNPKSFWFNPKHLEHTQEYFAKYGGKTIIWARFIPIVRTFAPFVAGMGSMNYGKFLLYNVIGGVVWVQSFVLLGFVIGSNEVVKKNFEIVVLGIIVLSVLPAVYEYWKSRGAKKSQPVAETLAPEESTP